MVEYIEQVLTEEELRQRPELIAPYGHGIKGPVTIKRPINTLSARNVGKRRRVRVRVRNQGSQEATFTAYASGVSFETDDIFKSESTFTVSPDQESDTVIDCPDGLLTEIGVVLTGQHSADTGITYPGRVAIDDDDLPGVTVPVVTGPITSGSPLTWPRHEASGDPGQTYLAVQNAGPAPSLTLSLPAGLSGYVISARCTISASASPSTVYLLASAPGSTFIHTLGVVHVPILTGSRTVTFSADLPLVEDVTNMTSPISASEGFLVTHVGLARNSSDPYATISNAEVIFSVRRA